jgi:hypothetical protein
MCDDPLLRRADRAIRECRITREQARENLQKARMNAASVRATVRIIRAERSQLGPADRVASSQEIQRRTELQAVRMERRPSGPPLRL